MNSTLDCFELSGPARIRAMFHPKLKISLADAGRVLGLSYTRVFRRLQEGTLALSVQTDENGRRFIRVDDLCAYLYPESIARPTVIPPATRRGPGRPRKTGGF